MKYILALITSILPLNVFAQDTANVGADVPAGTATPAASTPGIMEAIFPFAIVFFVFYILMLRPQQKKYKAHVALVSTLKKGDKVITGAGFAGTVTRAVDGDKFIEVEIANGIEVKVLRSSITELSDVKEPKLITEKKAASKKKAVVKK